MEEEQVLSLCNKIRQISFDLHSYLKYGHLEKVYENGLLHRMRQAGIKCSQQFPLKVYDVDGTVLGEYFADIFVEDRLIVELKACKTIAAEHIAQLLGYLRASRIRHGLLINFGSSKLEIKKLIL